MAKKQKKGKGKMTGLSGATWDFSKMSLDEAQYMRKCLEADMRHDRLMNPWKYNAREIIQKNDKKGWK